MSIDYAKALKDYGWDKLTAALDAGRFTDEHHDGYSEANIPGIGTVTRDPNGTVLFMDPESRAAYAATGNAPVYNYIGSPDGWSKYQVSHGGMSADKLGMLAALAIGGGLATGYIPGLEGAATGAAGSAGFAAPTAEELAAFGADTGGLGITGGGIGNAASLVDAGIGGSAGYGAGAAALGTDLAVDGVNQYANEANKLLQQQHLADAGTDLLPTNLPTVDLNGSSLSDLASKAKDISKLVSALKGSGAKSPFATVGVSGGGLVPNELSNMTPQMQLAQALQSNKSADTQAAPTQFSLGSQPQFSASYLSMPQGVQAQNPMSKLAKALQEESWQT
jgi:hypothetical protein